MKRGWARYQCCRCWRVCLIYLTCNIHCNRCGSRILRSSPPAPNIRNRILVSIHASFLLFRANVPCCCTWQSDCGGGSELISLLTRHSILVADWSRVYLVHTSCVLEGNPVVRRYTISIDFSAVVATAPPRYHLVALLLYTSRPRLSRIPPFRVLPIRFAPTRRSRRCYITSRMNTYKTFVRLAHGNDSCLARSFAIRARLVSMHVIIFTRTRIEGLFL